MGKKETTYKELSGFMAAAQRYLVDFPAKDKLEYALQKMLKRGGIAFESYNEGLEDLRIEHCSVDKDQIVLRDPRGNYQFTKDALKALVKAQKALADQATTVETYIATALPNDLPDTYREAFEGFVIDPGPPGPAQFED